MPENTEFAIFLDTDSDLLNAKNYLDILRDFPEPKSNLEERVRSLEREVHELKETMQEKSYTPSKTDLIYEKYRESLEKDYLGKIVAIDIDSGTIEGFGKSILEAYKEARKKSGKTKFSYKKVGSPYVCRLR